MVDGYVLEGDRVLVNYHRSDGCAASIAWRFTTEPQAEASACERSAASMTLSALRDPASLVAADAQEIVRVVRPAPGRDVPYSIVVRGRSSGTARSWPLLDQPVSLDVYDGIAVFSAVRGHGLYAVRLSDGRTALVGVDRSFDTPQIGPSGVVYQDDLDKGKHANGRITLKLITLAAVRADLEAAGLPLRTTAIRSISMDGPRVALAVSDPRGRCDRILFWNIPWHFVSRLTQPSGPTCTQHHAPGGITQVALAGSRAEWTTTYGTSTELLAADIVNCQEWVVTRLADRPGGDHLVGMSGDGPFLTFALTRHERELRGSSSIGVVAGTFRNRTLADGGATPVSVSADTRRVATLRDDGTVDVRTLGGRVTTTFKVAAPTAIALRLNRLAVLTATGRLILYSLPTGRLLRSLPAPAGARASIDMYYGIAVVTAVTAVYAIDVDSGRVAVVAHAPAPVRAQIEAPGIAYQYNTGGHGYLQFVPLSRVEIALGRS
ncbi:MAG: hypothetical protein ACXVZ2_09325 [Gaiellaceae bacterium]